MQERNIAKTRDYTLYLQVFWKLKVFYILVQCIQPNITINREWRQILGWYSQQVRRKASDKRHRRKNGRSACPAQWRNSTERSLVMGVMSWKCNIFVCCTPGSWQVQYRSRRYVKRPGGRANEGGSVVGRKKERHACPCLQ